MTIHDSHPFDPPAEGRDPLRRFRGRLATGVTLWTAGVGHDRAGLTVSSVMVAAGRPARVLALLDPDSDLHNALTATGSAVVHVLGWEHRMLAEMFAGTAPAPGGVFRQADFADTAWGPALATAPAYVGVRLAGTRPVGLSSEVECEIEEVVVGEDAAPLVHHRGRWRRTS